MKMEYIKHHSYFETQYQKFTSEGFMVARVAQTQKNHYLLVDEDGFYGGQLSGKLRHEAVSRKDLPSVGDWVYAKRIEDGNGSNHEHMIIYGVLDRKTCFSRKSAISGGRKIKNGIIVGGTTEEQVIAANIDVAFIVSGLDGNFNLQRIERYLTLCYNSGATPVLILNKSDCCDNIPEYTEKVQRIAHGIAIHTISAAENLGMEIFAQYLRPGITAVFLGSSGVGKSTMINLLLGEQRQKTNAVSSSNGKGRHTTTSSELLFHPSGYMIIDTPGMRELQLWSSADALSQNFDDVTRLIGECKYRDCKHEREPGCAIREAINDGTLDQQRYQSYVSQYEELSRLDGRIRQTEAYLSKREKLRAKTRQWGHK